MPLSSVCRSEKAHRGAGWRWVLRWGTLVETRRLHPGPGEKSSTTRLLRSHGRRRRRQLCGHVLSSVRSAGLPTIGPRALSPNRRRPPSVTASFALSVSGIRDGLGLISGSACPHYSSEERRRPVYRQLVGDGFPPGYAIDDQVGLHFVDGQLAEVASNAEGRSAYEVRLEGAAVRERPLAARSLG